MRNRLAKLIRDLRGPKRSPLWPRVRAQHLEIEWWCRYCGRMTDLEVHHITPFHVDPAGELNPGNLITLCERIGTHCHLEHGHLGNWRTWDVLIRQKATLPPPGPPKQLTR